MIKVQRNSECPEYYFKEGCYISEWWNSPADPDCSIARVRLPSGETTLPHILRNTVERYVLLEGEGLFRSGGKKEALGVGDVIWIEAETVQSIENTGSRDLIFLAICTPRFEEKNYRDVSGKD
ncbi:MAG: cupin domain-containing protein [Opitutales bacterium]|nr:cupin domain-containing protein [Opitutales bacterium]